MSVHCHSKRAVKASVTACTGWLTCILCNGEDNRMFPYYSVTGSPSEVGNEMYSTTGMPTNFLYIEDSLRLWEYWEKSAVSQSGYAQGFGTTITLDVGTEKVLTEVVECARSTGCPAEVTFDPTYPLVDGDVVHLLPIVTCGYVFGDKNYLSPLLSKFNLHP